MNELQPPLPISIPAGATGQFEWDVDDPYPIVEALPHKPGARADEFNLAGRRAYVLLLCEWFAQVVDIIDDPNVGRVLLAGWDGAVRGSYRPEQMPELAYAFVIAQVEGLLMDLTNEGGDPEEELGLYTISTVEALIPYLLSDAAQAPFETFRQQLAKKIAGVAPFGTKNAPTRSELVAGLE